MTDILFTYQHKPREIESLCLLKLEMERRGFTTDFICTFVPNRLLSFFKKAKLTVSSAMYNTDVLWFFVYDIVGFTKKVINIQWEQVLTNYDEANPNCFHNPKEFAKEVVHLCWGEEPKKRIIKGGVSNENAPITGAVHLDFLLKEFNGYFLNKKELSQLFNIDYQVDWCLFISSFTLHNMTEEEFKQLLNSFGDDAYEFKQITFINDFIICNIAGFKKGAYCIDIEEVENILNYKLMNRLLKIWPHMSNNTKKRYTYFMKHLDVEDI